MKLNLIPRASLSDDNSVGTNPYAAEDNRSTVRTVEKDNPELEKNDQVDEAPGDQSPLDDQANGFLDDLNIKVPNL